MKNKKQTQVNFMISNFNQSQLVKQRQADNKW